MHGYLGSIKVIMMDGAKLLASIMIIILIVVVLCSGIWLAGFFRMTGLFWLLFIIVYYFFVMSIARALINMW